MSTIRAHHPLLGLLRMLALAWMLLSLLALVGGVLAVVYAGAWGCVDSPAGRFGCTAATAIFPLAAAGSLFTAVVMLFFTHLFYAAGARAVDVAPRRSSLRDKAKGFVVDVVADIFD